MRRAKGETKVVNLQWNVGETTGKGEMGVKVNVAVVSA